MQLDEQSRLAVLRACAVLDTPPEEAFDDLVALAARLCGAPVALVSLVDEHRQWFKARVGVEECETLRRYSVCATAMVHDGVFEVDDLSLDDRFVDFPSVKEDGLRFYAGAPLRSAEGVPLGTLCVADYEPRPGGLSDAQRADLVALARQAMAQLELRRGAAALRRAHADLQDLLAMVSHEARHDALTGLANRRMLTERVDEVLARPVPAGFVAALLMVDLDGFKQVNDAHGHLVGDAVLQAVAARLNGAVREADLVCRLSGDEFIVLLEGATDLLAQRTADRLVQVLSEPIMVGRLSVQVRAAVGVVTAPPGQSCGATLLAEADRRLHEAKRAGRGRSVSATVPI